jgi:hypothetical protein
MRRKKFNGRKITILGMGPTANERRLDILKYVEDTEIWSLNNAYAVYPHLKNLWSRYFELHSYDYLKTWNPGHTGCHFTQLQRLGCPVWRIEPLPMVENQKKYDIVKYCRHFHSNYFLGSPSLMLILALYEHDNGDPVEEIRSYGIDTSDTQHAQQRQSWAWWTGKAQERGIKLTGTALNFQIEPEKDAGLQGLKEKVGSILVKDMNKSIHQNKQEEQI